MNTQREHETHKFNRSYGQYDWHKQTPCLIKLLGTPKIIGQVARSQKHYQTMYYNIFMEMKDEMMANVLFTMAFPIGLSIMATNTI